MSTYLKPIQLNETKAEGELLKKLDSIPLGRMYQASFKAVVRLHLYFTGRTQELMLEFSDQAQALILKHAGAEQKLNGSTGLAVQSDLLKMWEDTITQWRAELLQAQREAASIPFGVLAVTHDRMIAPAIGDQQLAVSEKLKAKSQTLMAESVSDGVFSPQLDVLLNAASEHLYGDTMNLSGRIWKLDRESRDGINSVLLNGISNGDSAWELANQLQQYLGANADCPRWTSTRLYGRTKSDIVAGDTTGLRSSPCDASGVSYNALRLARTEIQKAHALATDKVLMSQPWVTAEQINLSKAHAEEDICDETVQGGENSDGVYPVGEIELPLHPNCLCFKTGVLMPESEFTGKLKGWLDGSQDWAEMDAYESAMGGDVTQSLLPEAINLAVWLFGEQKQLSAFSGQLLGEQ